MEKGCNGISLHLEYGVDPKFRSDMRAVLIELEKEVNCMIENKFKNKLTLLSGKGRYIKIEEVDEERRNKYEKIKTIRKM